jgi:RimJ/RimL family protein N-acetyltransferase
MIDFNFQLQNERILLRPLKKDDFGAFAELSGDQAMWFYFTSDLSNKKELKRWVDDALIQHKNKTRLAFTVIDKASGKVAGSSSFGNISYRDQRVEIGWTWLGKSFQGKGINSTMKYLMLGYCFEALGFERVEFKTDVLNLPARKALARIGATEEGILRSHTLMTNNRRRDTIYYSVLKTEWERLKINWISSK